MGGVFDLFEVYYWLPTEVGFCTTKVGGRTFYYLCTYLKKMDIAISLVLDVGIAISISQWFMGYFVQFYFLLG